MTSKTHGQRASQINRLLRPRSIAVVGASDKPGALGASVMANLDRNGFAGDVYPINPKRERIGNRLSLNSVTDLPEGVDVAILAVPRAAVIDTLRGLAERKTGAAVIFSAGFAEGGEDGRREQAEIARLANEAGMIVEGPNCLGCVNHIDGIPLTFVETLATPPVKGEGGVGIVSQSGAMAAVLGTMLASRKLGLTQSVSTGNEAASGVEDYVDHLADDPDTRVIAMIVEQFRKPARFLAAARRARDAGKIIVLLHPGKSEAARASAATHTGALAGDYALMRTKVERVGVVFAESLEELGDITEIALRCPAPASPGVAVVGESGAFKALTLDLCEDLALALPSIEDDDAPAIRAAIPDFVPVSNPLDLTAQGLSEPDLYRRTLGALFADDRFGSIVTGLIQTDERTIGIKLPPILSAVREYKPDKPLIIAGLDEGAPVPQHYVDELRSLGVPYFPSAERPFRALKRLIGQAGIESAPDATTPLTLADLGAHSGTVSEHEAKTLLEPIGIPFPARRFVTSVDDAIAAAHDLGGAVALKIQSVAISHKSDVGGVILGLSDETALRSAWAKMHTDIAAHSPDALLEGVLVEAMGQPGVELIIGARNDPDWGPVVLAGFGGVSAEILKDVCLLAPDMTEAEIIDRLGTLRQAALLEAFRGRPALDLEAVARLIARLGRLMLSEPRIREIDLNPVIAYPRGQGVVALDALMIVGDQD